MCTCMLCGCDYSVDVMVPDDIWRQISPRPETEDGGLLCPQCIGKKLEEISGYASYLLAEL